MSLTTGTFDDGREIDWRTEQDRLVLWPAVKHQTGLSRTTAWRMERAGDFPSRVQVSPGRVGWRESELKDWSRSRGPARQRDPKSPNLPTKRLEAPTSRARRFGDPARGDGPEESSVPIAGIATAVEPAQDGTVGAPVGEFPKPLEASARRPRRGPRVSRDQMGFDF